MTTEEKAKAYDEAISIAKETYNTQPMYRNWLESMFSELQESEDERIRTALIRFHQSTINIDGIRGDDIVSWLEKQGEQKPAWSEKDERIYQSIIDDTVQENQLDSKQIDWLKSLKDRVQPQPKQDWKQENTGDLTDFENEMMHIGDSFFGQHAGLDPNDTNAIKEQANILLGLVSRQEWSEEDESMLQNILDCLKNGWRKLPTDIIKYESWLKSLRPQNTWKPSGEQMEALKSSTYCQDKQMSKVLFELYQDLKKLKED